MSLNVNLGGDRIGSGNRMNVKLKGFERSTHNLGRIWRSTAAPGVLYPIFYEYALNGDTWEINLNTITRTLPTNAPLFGSFKMQIDFYRVPLRLYVAQLKNNKLGVGMNMGNIGLPQVNLIGRRLSTGLAEFDNKMLENLESWQMSQNSLNAYLGIRGLGNGLSNGDYVEDKKNAIGHLAYMDIFKNYYSNKQEEDAYVISGEFLNYENRVDLDMITVKWKPTIDSESTLASNKWWFSEMPNWNFDLKVKKPERIQIMYHIGNPDNANDSDLQPQEIAKNIIMYPAYTQQDWEGMGALADYPKLIDMYDKVEYGSFYGLDVITFSQPNDEVGLTGTNSFIILSKDELKNTSIKLKKFKLENIDELIEHSSRRDNAEYDSDFGEPLKSAIGYTQTNDGEYINNGWFTMGGLLLKTYQSDVFNNWVSTEWIDGEGGINDITRVDTSDGNFTIDSLILASKIHKMLLRIAVKGGSYEDWQEAVWGEKVFGQDQTPVYIGGASTEIIFEEVVSTASTDSEVVGGLAGKGRESGKLKGGYIKTKIKEPSIIMGIMSLTPRIDYSQGNAWHTNLKNMDNFHKPSLDGIGFQELITEQMAFWEQKRVDDKKEFFSAGKQPAWINYQTSYNQTYGEFAEPKKAMYMTLNRRYESEIKNGIVRIKDLTTYIDPSKYNYVFSYKNLDAQNFWVQIGMNVTARRKMSANQIPNL